MTDVAYADHVVDGSIQALPFTDRDLRCGHLDQDSLVFVKVNHYNVTLRLL